MATNTDRIAQLETTVNELKRTEAVRDVRFKQEFALPRVELRHQAETHQASREEVAEMKGENAALRSTLADADQRNAVLEAAVKELKTASEKWGQRLWQLAAGIALALIGGVAGYLLKR